MAAPVEECYCCKRTKSIVLMEEQMMNSQTVHVCKECLRTKRFLRQKKRR